MPSPPTDDPRVLRTRAALLGAFNRLVLARGYDAVGPATIATAAGVARSTFYEHYAGKPDLLRQALRPLLQPLADAIDDAPPRARLEAVLAHFWDNRHLARVFMSGRLGTIMRGLLAELVEANLRRSHRATTVPWSLAATHVAHGQLGLVDAWLTNRDACDAATLASALVAVSHAASEALRADRLLRR